MRRKYFGLAIAALATLGPMQAWGSDREIAEQIIQRLKSNRDSGALKDFTLDMKVDNGVVLFRGNVTEDSQKDLVLQAAEGINGIAGVVDEVRVSSATAQVMKPAAPVSVMGEPADQAEPEVNPRASDEDFSLRQALASGRKAIRPHSESLQVMPGEVRPAAAVEPNDDAEVVAAVVAALGRAKESGQLRGFGVDVKSHHGVLQLTGRASSPMQRDTIIEIAESVPGVAGVREAIAIPTAAPNLPRLPEPPSLQEVSSPSLTPVQRPARSGVSARTASTPLGLPAVAAPYRMQGGASVPAVPSSYDGSVAGQPVPMAPYSAVGAPRYDSPNLPNYAWPGYAAHPNYAALTYPQQYSPSAWPYIGPFYPYPQVPLGWRRVSLEWDDGWWFLDFTDR